MRKLTSEEVAAAAGITYRQLDYWCRAGYLSPEMCDKPTRAHAGKARRWDSDEALAAICMGQLTAAGLLPGVAAPIARGARQDRARVIHQLAIGIMIILDVPQVPVG